MNTKLHAVTDKNRRPLSVLMTAGPVSNYMGAAALLDSLPIAQWMLADRGSDAEWFRNAQEACRNTPRQMPNCLLLSHLPRSSRHVLAMCPEPKHFDDFNKDTVWDMISPPALRLHWRYPDPGTARALNVTHNTLSKKKVSRDLERESLCYAPVSIYIRI